MEAGRAEANVVPFRLALRRRPDPIADLRFRRLAGEARWATLPEAVRARFERHIGAGSTILYSGEVVECRMSLIGRILAQLVRLIGAPLPLFRDTLVPAVVTVTEDEKGGGQHWTRIYGRRSGFPQVVRSSKCFAGPTGLEEHIGRGIGIALRLEIESGALHFLSDHYFLKIGALRLRFPRWLSPGRMRVSHVDCGDGSFAFVLSLAHPWLGELVRQTAMFEERPDRSAGR